MGDDVNHIGTLSALAAQNRREAVDYVYNTLDDMLLAGRHDSARALLLDMAATPLPLAVLLSGLVITLPWVGAMGDARRALYEAAQKVAEDRAPEALRGLAAEPAP